MHIHTIEDNFDYQAKKILTEFIKDYEDAVREGKTEGKSLNDIIWDHKEQIGELFINRLSDYFGDSENMVQDEWDKIETEEEEEN